MKNIINYFVKKYKALLYEYKRVDFRYTYNRSAVLNSVFVFVLMEFIFIGFSYITEMNANLTYLFLTTSFSVICSLLLYHYRMLIKWKVEDVKFAAILHLLKLVFVQTLFILIFIFMFAVDTTSVMTIILLSTIVIALSIFYAVLDLSIDDSKNHVLFSSIIQSIMLYIVFGCCVYLIGIKNPSIVVVLYTVISYLIEFLRRYTVRVWENKIAGVVMIVCLAAGFILVVDEIRTYRYGITYLVLDRNFNSKILKSDSQENEIVEIPLESGFDYETYKYVDAIQLNEQVNNDDELFLYNVVEHNDKVYVHAYYNDIERTPLSDSSTLPEVMDHQSWVFIYDENLTLQKTHYFYDNRVYLKVINDDIYLLKETSKVDDSTYSLYSNFSVYVIKDNVLAISEVFGEENYMFVYSLLDMSTFFYQEDILYVSPGFHILNVVEPNVETRNSPIITGWDHTSVRGDVTFVENFEVRNNDTVFLVQDGSVSLFGDLYARQKHLIDGDTIVYLEKDDSKGYTRTIGYLSKLSTYKDNEEIVVQGRPLHITDGFHDLHTKMEVIDGYIYIQTEEGIRKYNYNKNLVSHVSSYNKDVMNSNYFLLDTMVLHIEDSKTLVRLSLEDSHSNVFSYEGSAICETPNPNYFVPTRCYTNSYGFMQVSYLLMVSLVIKRKNQLIL